MRTIINISLPEGLNREIEKVIKKGKYSTKSEFIRELLRSHLEDELVRQVEESEREIRAGKGKILKSLHDLR
jgi:putative addiction module CopG family antidote